MKLLLYWFVYSLTEKDEIDKYILKVEDNGLSSCSFPFIVAEQEICSEICKLENVIEAAETADDIQMRTKLMEEKTQALYFIQEMGWLLHRNRAKVRLGPVEPLQDCFHFNRFMLLVGFSMDHDWCAVMKKLLNIIFEGTVDIGEHTSAELALLKMDLLHKAVKRNCRPMVELLLKFVPANASDGGDSKEKQVNKSPNRFIFRPDSVGPAGLTPLHVAASVHGLDNVLDALTDDPGLAYLSAIVIYLYADDFKQAEKCYNDCSQVDAFLRSDQNRCASKLLAAYTDGDVEEIKHIAQSSGISHLDHVIIRLARKLPTGDVNALKAKNAAEEDDLDEDDLT